MPTGRPARITGAHSGLPPEPIPAAGAALEVALQTAPLEEGFSATYRTFDMMEGAMQEHRIEVTGSETVELPGGTFEAFRVESSRVDGSGGDATFWVERAPPTAWSSPKPAPPPGWEEER